ncbi:reverse transcriptase domain-containing protein [Tanacetum coccineum]
MRTKSYEGVSPEKKPSTSFDNVIAAHQGGITGSPQPQGKFLRPDSTGPITFVMRKNSSELATHVNEPGTSPQGIRHPQKYIHMERVMKRYGVVHIFSTAYHSRTNGQVENTNRAIKRILKKTIGNNRKEWSHKLDDALLFPGKLKSRWYGLFAVSKDMENGAIELCDEDRNEFIVNKQRVKPYQKDALDFNGNDDVNHEDEG